MDLQELRERMNRIDSDLVKLYLERMETAGEIGAWKRENGVPVYDPARERQLMDRVAEMAGEENENGVRALFGFLISQSRTRQLLDEGRGTIGQKLRKAMDSTSNFLVCDCLEDELNGLLVGWTGALDFCLVALCLVGDA